MIKPRNTLGMLVVGGGLWAAYLLYANALIVLTDAHHLAIEAVGIPASAVAYYLLNARFVFHQPISWHAFRSFVGITIFGWASFLTVSALSTDVAGLAPQAGHLAGVAVNSAVNLIVQQSVTFKPRGSKETANATPTR